MKYLLNGVAIAAVLAIAAPVWAQTTPMKPSTPPAASSSGAPPAAGTAAPPAGGSMSTKPMASKSKAMPKKHYAMHRKWGKTAGDSMTEQLNREELARIQGGGAPAAAPGPGPTGGSMGSMPASGQGQQPGK
jgi:hypothetical protein